ncbi:hypothetical protein BGS_0171 [Beggiatoa sp. SS]|nr:hypothetical protein BGS_0171 [Beggiatoa sp. SS]
MFKIFLKTRKIKGSRTHAVIPFSPWDFVFGHHFFLDSIDRVFRYQKPECPFFSMVIGFLGRIKQFNQFFLHNHMF